MTSAKQLAEELTMNRAAPAAGELGGQFGEYADALSALAERALAGGAASQIASEDIARVLTAVMKVYAAKVEKETEPAALPPPPVLGERVTPTEAVVLVSELMRAVNLNLFDLSMWYRRSR
jgi:hypothetical protein